MKPVFVNGVLPDSQDTSLAASIRDIFLKATDDLAWLGKGEVVLVKPALNSPDPYPSTTHPLAIRVVAELLEEHGANVVIGDQSGIGHVLHHPGGVIRGSTKKNYAQSGMGRKDDARFVSFEEGGWDEGFDHYLSPNTRSWPEGFFITGWAKKADHIISLPRVSAHSQAGATLGFKIMVGTLREDSRMTFHANGPYNKSITDLAKGSTLVSQDDGTGTFFEKIVEISDALRDKLRLTLFVATQAQTTFGPDRFSGQLGPIPLGRAYIMSPRPGLVFASRDQVAAETFALSVLKDLKQSVPFFPRLAERIILFQNKNVQDFGTIPVRDHPYIRHAMKIGLGELPGEIIYKEVPLPVQKQLGRCFE